MMENHFTHGLFERRSINKSRTHAPVKWFKEWVPQEVVATGGKCLVLKWVNEAMLKAIKEKSTRPYVVEPEPEPTTEVLFLCSYEGCGKTFIDAGALKKHSHVHGERQYVCQYENCGKKFLDSSKLKRHHLIHTGERHFVCTYEGCGKAFSLDFNLRSHMKTHSQENYHVCPYPECGKRYAHEYKLKNHVSAAHHDKNVLDAPKYVVSVEKPGKIPEKPWKTPEKPMKSLKSSTGGNTQKASAGGASRSAASIDRPFACPYEGCDKAYIHEYKLNLHLRREHPGHFPNENTKMDEGSDQEEYGGKRGKVEKQNRAKPNLKLPPSKVSKRKSSTASPANLNVVKKPWPLKEEIYDEEDSEETEEELDNIREGRRYGDNIDDDDDEDEETDYEE